MKPASEISIPEENRFLKKPVPVKAVRLEETVEVETMEGNITGEPGDWLIEGVEGERYPCDDGIFRQTYDAGSEPAESELTEAVDSDER